MGQWDHPEGQTLDAYTPPLSRHRVNLKMPRLGVEPKISEFTVSPSTLPYCQGTQVGAYTWPISNLLQACLISMHMCMQP